MLNFFRKAIPDTHPFRLLYHKIMAVIAAIVYWFPANNLIVVGVTGTNGKTTTVNFITHILETAGNKVGMTSTIAFKVGGEKWSNVTKQTTLSPFKTQKLLRRMVNEGCKYAVLEVSSHAVTQSRIFGVNIDVAVITNVTPEHVDYHGNFNSYLNAKGKLFEKVSVGKRKFGVSKVLVMNADDKYFSFFDQFVADRKLTYGLEGGTVFATDLQKETDGSHFVMHVPNNEVPIQLNLPGEFNIMNALASASVCISLQIPIDIIKKGLETINAVAGRYEHVDAGQKYSIVIDYAHDETSLENLFSMYKRLTKGRLFAVFGATGGGRDVKKRPKMGEIADEYSDYIVLTDDDPYEDDEIMIIDQISRGISRREGKNFWKIPDRREAIRLALTLAREDDTVVISGKGAEEVMMLRGKRVEWNDRQVVEELLDRTVEVEIGPDKWEERENVCIQS